MREFLIGASVGSILTFFAINWAYKKALKQLVNDIFKKGSITINGIKYSIKLGDM